MGTFHQFSSEPHFDMLVCGSGGGPTEDNLSSYLFKPRSQIWENGYSGIEGGAGVGAVRRIWKAHPQLFCDFGEIGKAGESGGVQALWEAAVGFMITHAHFDHVCGLVLMAGSCGGNTDLFGCARTIQNLQNIFDGGVWPALASFSRDTPYTYSTVIADGKTSFSSSPGLKTYAMPLSHGKAKGGIAYDSTAFFNCEESTGHFFLFFGDVSADSVAGDTRNLEVWKKAAPLIAAERLSTIFIECSYESARPVDMLFGHLSPPFLFEELASLSKCLHHARSDTPNASLAGSLSGLNIMIIHIKDSFKHPGKGLQVIKQELDALEQVHKTGVNFHIVDQGTRLAF